MFASCISSEKRMIIIHVNYSLNKQYRESDKIVYQRLYSVNGENAEARAKRIKRSSAVKIDLSLERRPNSKHWFTTSFFGGRCRKAMLGVCLRPCALQTPSTGLRHPSLEEGARNRCSECVCALVASDSKCTHGA